MKTIGFFAAVLLFININCIGQSNNASVTEENCLSSENVQLDQNYKHNAGKQKVASSYSLFKEKYAKVSDANYKHQAGRRKNKKENVLAVNSRNTVYRNNNYKFQFPSR